MNIVLLSGGSGKRLWPLSNDIRSKQFIKLFKKEDGSYESMVQRVYRQIRSINKDASVTIAASRAQVSSIRNQLGDSVQISVEHCRRDTFPAIALVSAYLRDVQGVDENEPVVVCPVDPCVEDGYFKMLKRLSDQAEKGEANLVLMGIAPTYPSEKYGYIIPQDAGEISGVLEFKEKPVKAAAEDFPALIDEIIPLIPDGDKIISAVEETLASVKNVSIPNILETALKFLPTLTYGEGTLGVDIGGVKANVTPAQNGISLNLPEFAVKNTTVSANLSLTAIAEKTDPVTVGNADAYVSLTDVIPYVKPIMTLLSSESFRASRLNRICRTILSCALSFGTLSRKMSTSIPSPAFAR